MGSALAYAALAQAPAATVAGAASDGLVTELATRLPLCPGAPSTAHGFGFRLRAESRPARLVADRRPAGAEGRRRAVRRRHRPGRAGRGPGGRRARRPPGGGCSRRRSRHRPRRIGRGAAAGRAAGQRAGQSDGGVLFRRWRLARSRQADRRDSRRAWYCRRSASTACATSGRRRRPAGRRRPRGDPAPLSRGLGAPAGDPARLLLRRRHPAVRRQPAAALRRRRGFGRSRCWGW